MARRAWGAKNEEVVVMNQLTSNLHFLLVSFLSAERKAPEDPH
jgi:kynureninase